MHNIIYADNNVSYNIILINFQNWCVYLSLSYHHIVSFFNVKKRWLSIDWWNSNSTTKLVVDLINLVLSIKLIIIHHHHNYHPLAKKEQNYYSLITYITDIIVFIVFVINVIIIISIVVVAQPSIFLPLRNQNIIQVYKQPKEKLWFNKLSINSFYY